MENLITENSLFKTPQEKADFVADKQKVATAFWLNFFGMIGLFTFSSKKGLMKTYFTDDKQLRLSTIGDDNKDLSLLVKLYWEAGGLPQSTADKITRLLVKMKQKTITSKDFDENVFRDIVSEIRYQSVRPHPILIPLIKGYIDGDYQAVNVAKEIFYLVKSKKKDFLPVAGEFYEVAKQYIPQMGNIARPAQMHNPANTNNPSAAVAIANTPVNVPAPPPVTPVQAPSVQPVIAPAPATVVAPTPVTAPAPAPQLTAVNLTPVATVLKNGEFSPALKSPGRGRPSHIPNSPDFIAQDNARQWAEVHLEVMRGTLTTAVGDTKKQMIVNIDSGLRQATTSATAVQQVVAAPVPQTVAPAPVVVAQVIPPAPPAPIAPPPVVAPPPAIVQAPVAPVAVQVKTKAVTAPVEFESLFFKVYKMKQKEISTAVKAAKVDADEFKSWVNQVLEGKVPNVSNTFYSELTEDFDLFLEGIIPWAARGTGTTTAFVARLIEKNIKFILSLNRVSVSKLIESFSGKQATSRVRQAFMLYHAVNPMGNIFILAKSKFKNIKDDAASDYKKLIKYLWDEKEFENFGLACLFGDKTFSNLNGNFDFVEILGLDNGNWNPSYENIFSDGLKERMLNKPYGRAFFVQCTTDYFKIAGPSVSTFLTTPYADSNNTEQEYLDLISKYRENIIRRLYANGTYDTKSEYNIRFSKALIDSNVGMQPGEIEMKFSAALPQLKLDPVGSRENIDMLLNMVKSQTSKSSWATKYPVVELLGDDILFADKTLLAMLDHSPESLGAYLAYFKKSRLERMVKSDDSRITLALLKLGVFSDNSFKNLDFNTMDSTVAKRIFENPKSISLMRDDQKQIFADKFGALGISIGMGKFIPVVATALQELDGYIKFDESQMAVMNTSRTFKGIHMPQSVLNFVRDNPKSDSIQAAPSYVNEYKMLTNDQSAEMVKLLLDNGQAQFLYRFSTIMPLQTCSSVMIAYERLMKEQLAQANTEGDPFKVATLASRIQLIDDRKKELFKKHLMAPMIRSVTDGVIKPDGDIDGERMATMLRYNNISLPNSYDPKLSIADNITNGSFDIQDLKVTKVDTTDSEMNDITAKIFKMRNGKHGTQALKVLEVFDVDIPSQLEGVEEKTAELIADGVAIKDMEPVWHGTGAVAASMILRYGFTVIPSTDPSAAGRMLGDGIYYTDVSDKAQQYVKSDSSAAFNRELGTEGYFFEMYALIGRPKIDTTYVAAGGRARGSKMVSAEWCAHDYKRQIIIKRAYRVVKVEASTIQSMLGESEAQKGTGLSPFDNMLYEAEMSKLPKNVITVVLVRDQVTDEMTKKFGKNVMIDSYNSFNIYNDSVSGIFQVDSIENMFPGDFDKLLSGDFEEVVKYNS